MMRRAGVACMLISVLAACTSHDDSASTQATAAGSDFAVAPGAAFGSIDIIDTSKGRQLRTAGKIIAHVKIRAGESLLLFGWGIDPVAHSPAEGVVVKVDATDLPATYGLARSDVAQVLKSPNLVNSGFSASIPSAALAAGPHSITTYVVDASGRTARAFKTQILVDVSK